jgi:hypothetical protein
MRAHERCLEAGDAVEHGLHAAVVHDDLCNTYAHANDVRGGTTPSSMVDPLSVAAASSRFCGLASLHASTSCSTNLRKRTGTSHVSNVLGHQAKTRHKLMLGTHFPQYLEAGVPIAVMIADSVCMASRARFLFLSKMLQTPKPEHERFARKTLDVRVYRGLMASKRPPSLGPMRLLAPAMIPRMSARAARSNANRTCELKGKRMQEKEVPAWRPCQSFSSLSFLIKGAPIWLLMSVLSRHRKQTVQHAPE